jgi:hypothetical protein
MRHFLLLTVLALFCGAAFGQKDSLRKKKHQFYLSWGYTHAIYSKSTIHFKNTSMKENERRGTPDNYDFTIYNVTAHDRPDFDKIKDVVNLTIPQFVGRAGFMFNDKWGIEMNYDHTKYVVDDWQRTHIKGQIDGAAIDKDTTMNPNRFLHFEHTDGANFWMLNAVRKIKLYNPNSNFCASAVLKPGAGVVFPRTDVTIFGQELNNDWHVAGWIVGAEGGLRIEFMRNGIFEFVAKGTYADYRRCFILGRGNGNANHHFVTGQLTATIGLRFDSK